MRYQHLHMLILMFLFLGTGISGCSLPEIKSQADLIESFGVIEGKISAPVDQKNNVTVLLFRKSQEFIVLERKYTPGKDGKYRFNVSPDTYYLATFIDKNRDDVYQPNEPISYYGAGKKSPAGIVLGKGENITLDELTVHNKLEEQRNIEIKYRIRLPVANIGRVISLNDPVFDPRYVSMGLWEPLSFIDQVGGGLFFLQEYDEGKIPVLFIHGTKGGAHDWKEIIAKMDTTQFQPWLLYYPSGIRLGLVSDYLVEAINRLYSDYRFQRFYVIGHSVGGLVTRSFVMKHVQSRHSAKIAFVMTINSPMLGLTGARFGVEHSPIVIPSWRDIAAGSKFIRKLNAWSWPRDVLYDLVFSYKSGEGSDGVVPLESQLPMKFQLEATRIYGFNSSHTGILRDKKFINHFNAILRESMNQTAR